MINVEVTKNENENNASLIRRFTKRFKSSGILQDTKKVRFHERKLSPKLKREKKLRGLQKSERMEELYKLGKR